MYCVKKKLLQNIDELVFCNDSCFGPIHLRGFQELFNKNRLKHKDFWGISGNNYGVIKNNDEYKYVPNIFHIQSYFFVLKPSVFLSSWFQNFMNSITVQPNKNEIIIQYEQRLSQLVIENNHTFDTHIPFEGEKNNVKDWQDIIHKNGLLIKKSQYKDIMLHPLKLKNYKWYLILKYSILKIGFFTTLKILICELKNRFLSGDSARD